jgi:hypothetical protein
LQELAAEQSSDILTEVNLYNDGISSYPTLSFYPQLSTVMALLLSIIIISYWLVDGDIDIIVSPIAVVS